MTDHDHFVPPNAIDQKWRPTALWLRNVLEAAYGRPQEKPCLPDEPDWCGHGYAAHAAASVGALRAIVEDLSDHLPEEARKISDGVYEQKIEEIRAKSDHTHGGR